MMNTMKLAVIGPRDDVLPYVSLGAAVCMTTDPAEAGKALHDFAHGGHPVILIADDLLGMISDAVNAVEKDTPAAISALPGKDGAAFSKSRIQAQVNRAIGFHVNVA